MMYMHTAARTTLSWPSLQYKMHTVMEEAHQTKPGRRAK